MGGEGAGGGSMRAGKRAGGHAGSMEDEEAGGGSMRPDNRGYGGGRPSTGYQERPRVNYAAMTQYYDAEGRLKREVFIEWPKQIAETLRISRTNMRRAY